MKIGFMELLVVFLVALVVIGPDKLPRYAQKFGSALREFRKATDHLTQDLKESVITPLEEAQQPLREALEPLDELDAGVRSNLREVEHSLRDIGKPKPKSGKNTAAVPETDSGQQAPAQGQEAEEPPVQAQERPQAANGTGGNES